MLKEISNLSGFLYIYLICQIPPSPPPGSYSFPVKVCFTNRTLLSPVHVLLIESSPCFTNRTLLSPVHILLMSPVHVLLVQSSPCFTIWPLVLHEQYLNNCSDGWWRNHDCWHNNDAGVECLLAGNSACNFVM